MPEPDSPVPSTDRASLKSTIDPALRDTLNALITLVRAKMRDYPELNRLTAGRETSDREIAMALLMTVDDYNNTPPLLDVIGLVAYPSKDLLVQGTIIQILTSVGILRTRNQISYTDGQGGMQVSENAREYQGWLNMLTSTYEQKKFRLKQAINLNDALGVFSGVSSEYLAINGYLNRLDADGVR